MRTLEVDQFEVSVRLGCQKNERDEGQKVHFYVKVYFESKLEAENSDCLQDTVCYQDICEQIKAVSIAKEYNLIEHLAYSVREQLKSVFSLQRFELTVHKLDPPIEGIKGGTKYTIMCD